MSLWENISDIQDLKCKVQAVVRKSPREINLDVIHTLNCGFTSASLGFHLYEAGFLIMDNLLSPTTWLGTLESMCQIVLKAAHVRPSNGSR
jgi:hypothetical protein